MSGTPSPKLGFRADINGLRAIAVLAVLAYHFGIAPFGSGFTGVDVFFVISGYLMTGIIVGRMDRGTFSIPGFYLDRARRIVPALLALVVAVLALGWFILLPDEYLILAKHSGSAATFASNLLFWKEAGYFDPGLDQKWLLHTWSLSVEWQFYLLYPLIVLGISKLARTRLRAILAGLALLSFALMLWLSVTNPDTGFYLLPPRAWEMLAGGIVFLSPALTGRAARAAQLWGLALILASAVAFAPAAWPSVWAILPVAGAALVILAGRSASRITGNGVAAWVGLNSYSIYLWHWPLVVLLRRSGHTGDWRWTAAALAASFVLGHLSWRFVERLAQPRTRAPHIHTGAIRLDWRTHAVFAGAVLAVLLVSAGLWKARGVPQRFSAEVKAAANDAIPAPAPGSERCYADIGETPESCVLGPATAPVLAIVVGDSQADAALPGILAAIPAGVAGGVRFSAYSACPPVIGASAASPSRCGAFTASTIAPLARPRTIPVILVSRWTHYADAPGIAFPEAPTPSAERYRAALYASMCKLAKAGPTYALLPLPEFPWWASRELAHRLIADPNAPDIAYPVAQHRARNAPQVAVLRRAAAECGLHLLDPEPVFCPKGKCMGSIGHRALFRDEQHVSGFGAATLAPVFAPVFAASSTAITPPAPRR